MGGEVTAVDAAGDLLRRSTLGLVPREDRRRASSALTLSTTSGVPAGSSARSSITPSRMSMAPSPWTSRAPLPAPRRRPRNRSNGRSRATTPSAGSSPRSRRPAKIVDVEDHGRRPAAGRPRPPARFAASCDFPLPSSPSTAIAERGPVKLAVGCANRGRTAGRARRRRAPWRRSACRAGRWGADRSRRGRSPARSGSPGGRAARPP